mmetsp:Transcript_27472/g.53354  ORF Transcript_27472/g.53354 Transcript_27472/m.53354 type:complete len:230 (+) Transcript_27472:1136-1825(+)
MGIGQHSGVELRKDRRVRSVARGERAPEDSARVAVEVLFIRNCSNLIGNHFLRHPIHGVEEGVDSELFLRFLRHRLHSFANGAMEESDSIHTIPQGLEVLLHHVTRAAVLIPTSSDVCIVEVVVLLPHDLLEDLPNFSGEDLTRSRGLHDQVELLLRYPSQGSEPLADRNPSGGRQETDNQVENHRVTIRFASVLAHVIRQSNEPSREGQDLSHEPASPCEHEVVPDQV